MVAFSKTSGSLMTTPSAFSMLTVEEDVTELMLVSLLSILMETAFRVIIFWMDPPLMEMADTALLIEIFATVEFAFPSSLMLSAFTSAEATDAAPSRTIRTLVFVTTKD